MTLMANPIKRRFRGSWYQAVEGFGEIGTPRANRDWVAICPDCGVEVTWLRSYPHYARATRKNTKDALYRHRQEHHKPGSVGGGQDENPDAAAGTYGRA